MTILQLPPEILLQIAELISPRAFYSLATSCRLMWRLLAPGLDCVKVLRDRHKILRVAYPSQQGCGPSSVEILSKMLKREVPDFAEHLVVASGAWRYSWEEESRIRGTEAFCSTAQDRLQTFLPILLDNPYLQELESLLVNILTEGNCSVILIQLLTMLPDLRTVQISHIDRPPQTAFFNAIMRFVTISFDHKIHQAIAPFRNLQKLTITGGTLLDEGVDMQWLATVALLPRLRSLCVDRVEDLATELWTQPARGNVRNLELVRCTTFIDRLLHLLKSLHLESVIYTSATTRRGREEEELPCFDASRIVKGLSEVADYSLRHLSLFAEDPRLSGFRPNRPTKSLPFASLLQFKALRSAHLEWKFVQPLFERRHEQLGFPTCIKSLLLSNCPFSDIEQAQEVMTRFRSQFEEMTHLRIQLVGYRDFSRRQYTAPWYNQRRLDDYALDLGFLEPRNEYECNVWR